MPENPYADFVAQLARGMARFHEEIDASQFWRAVVDVHYSDGIVAIKIDVARKSRRWYGDGPVPTVVEWRRAQECSFIAPAIGVHSRLAKRLLDWLEADFQIVLLFEFVADFKAMRTMRVARLAYFFAVEEDFRSACDAFEDEFAILLEDWLVEFTAICPRLCAVRKVFSELQTDVWVWKNAMLVEGVVDVAWNGDGTEDIFRGVGKLPAVIKSIDC